MLRRFFVLLVTPTLGVAVAIVVLVVVGWKVALLVIAATLVVFVIQLYRFIKRGLRNVDDVLRNDPPGPVRR